MFHAFLIAAQFGFSAILVLSANWSPLPFLEILLATPGVVLAVWAWVTMGLRRLRIQPGTTRDTRLLQHGPYGVVRHPMYVGLLWFTAALLWTPWSWWRPILWLALFGVLSVKAREEEIAMAERFDEYGDYCKRVWSFFPTFIVR